MGVGADARRAACARADLGVAMQLTNIARDVGEDARRGRVYLPDELLAALRHRIARRCLGAARGRRRDGRAQAVRRAPRARRRPLPRRRPRHRRCCRASCRLAIASRAAASTPPSATRRGARPRLARRAAPTRRWRASCWLVGPGAARRCWPRPARRTTAGRRTSAARRSSRRTVGRAPLTRAPCASPAGLVIRASPCTPAALAALPDGDGVLEHVLQLEQTSRRRTAGRRQRRERARRAGHAPEYDVALAGGGLSLIYAAYLARPGHKVVVFDRRRIGCGHREWNISRERAGPLARAASSPTRGGVAWCCSQYDRGIVPLARRRHPPVRRRARLRGRREAPPRPPARARPGAGRAPPRSPRARRLPHRPRRCAVDLGRSAPAAARPTSTARLLIDGIGAASPHARFDLAAPPSAA